LSPVANATPSKVGRNSPDGSGLKDCLAAFFGRFERESAFFVASVAEVKFWRQPIDKAATRDTICLPHAGQSVLPRVVLAAVSLSVAGICVLVGPAGCQWPGWIG
jgi:hypothetical protein